MQKVGVRAKNILQLTDFYMQNRMVFTVNFSLRKRWPVTRGGAHCQNHNESEWKNDGRKEDPEFQFTAYSRGKNVPVDPSNILAALKMLFS